MRKVLASAVAAVGTAALTLGSVGVASATSGPVSTPPGGITVNPLQYSCTVGGPTCNNVGITHDFYNGTNVEALYTQKYFCDTSVSSHASNGCEAGASYSKLPPGVSSASQTDPLYVPIPLGFTPTQQLQCPTGKGCIDHPMHIDLSRLAGALPGHPTAASLQDVSLPGHDHVIASTNGNLPEWWPIVVVGVTNQAAWTSISNAKSYSEIQSLQANKASGVTGNIPTNAFLFFQTLPGTVPQARADVTSSAVPPSATNPDGTTFTNLKNNCTTSTSPSCENVGVTSDFINGQTVNALYSQNYFCDSSVSSQAPSGCEVGAPYSKLPPGVSSVSNTDPLYIPVPLFSPGPSALQCAAGQACIDHPSTVDLSRLASALGKPASALANVAFPGHDHILTTTNNNQPEWWPVVVVGVTNPASFAKIEAAKSYSEIQALQANKANGVTANIPTNAFLWFQTLPGHASSLTSAQATTPAGAPNTGGGGTAGFRNIGLLAGGGLAVMAASGLLVFDRRRKLNA